MSRLILILLGEGASGGLEPVPRLKVNVPAQPVTITRDLSVLLSEDLLLGQRTD